MAPRYEMCIGLNKGQKTTKIKNLKYQGDRKIKGIQPSRLKGVSTNITSLCPNTFFYRIYDETSTNPFTDNHVNSIG